MAARACRDHRGRLLGAGDAAARCVAGAVSDLAGSGVAHRRRRRRTARRDSGRCDRRMVVRLRLSPRGTLLGRPRLPGRRQGLRLAVAVRGHRAARGSWPATRRWGSRSRACSGRAGRARLIALAVALTVTEWLRGFLFTGFPWNSYGYALTGSLALSQGAALIGIWGLTFVAVAVFASPAVLLDERSDTRRPWLPLALGLILLAALAAYGTWRLSRTPTAFVDNVRLRIMQPNLQQDEKFNYSAKQRVMSQYLELSDRATGPRTSGVRDATHLIWPESAFPFLLTREPDAMAQIAALLPQGTVLITGAIRAPDVPPGQQDRARLQFDLRHRSRRHDPVGLRQDASCAVRRVSAVPEFSRKPRPAAAHQAAWRFHCRRSPPRDGRAARAAHAAVHLLRDHLSGRSRCRAASGPAGCSISPTTVGSASAAVLISIFARRVCAPSSKDSRWCARRTPACRR